MRSDTSGNYYLFSIDLEDIRLRLKNPENYEERVPQNTYTYLNWLNKYNAKCTFFVTGDVAVLYPSLIKEIALEGHEIACHTSNHIPIDRQTPDEFKKDLENNISSLMRAGVGEISGFRAPVFSLIEKTAWAYDVLLELGFSYSSSVLPAKNPLYGWETFGAIPRKVNDGLFEIPVTVGTLGPLTVPAFGGVYFRVLPQFFINNITAKCIANNLPAVGYFHPYDIDTEQEKYMNPDINNNYFYNFLMYYNRNKVFKRLNGIMAQDFKICTYISYVQNNLN